MAAVLEKLCSSQKIERDRGVNELKTYIIKAEDQEIHLLTESIQRLLSDSTCPWESKHGALMGTKTLVQSGRCSALDDISECLMPRVLCLLEDAESRVRMASGEVLGVLCHHVGPHVYISAKEQVLDGVRKNLERQPLHESMDVDHTEKLLDKLGPGHTKSARRSSLDAEQIFHDTAGWKSLETWMKCLQNMIDGCAANFNPYVEQELLDLIFETLTHTNRFVRETGYYVCGSLVSCNFDEDTAEMTCLTEDNAIYQHGQVFADHLGRGLADNWSQVRLAASVATRKFLTSLPLEEAKDRFFPVLLPPLCLNRYYVAEGVRIYNQETWKQVVGVHGKIVVEKNIKNVVEFYISQTEADNHAVREAACACIAELGSKVSQDIVRPYVLKLLDSLLVCFKDESWPVRDASCVACGNFVLCFKEEARGTMPELYPLFYENLQDPIASVREGAALALANVVRVYGDEASSQIMEKVKAGLLGVKDQPASSEKYASLDKGPATYGVVKKMRDNDMDLHTDRQMYSCGSLAPKMHRGKRGGGCMDHQFRKPSEPWEMADGCINLVAELSDLQDLSQQVTQLLPVMITAVSHRHYTHYVQLLENYCKQLPKIGKRLGKRILKMHLEMFFDGIFAAMTCDNALASTAAAECLGQFGSMLGPNILRGRVEQYDPRYLQYLDMPQMTGPPV